MAALGLLKEDDFLATLFLFQSGDTTNLGGFFPGVFGVSVVCDELPALVDGDDGDSRPLIAPSAPSSPLPCSSSRTWW